MKRRTGTGVALGLTGALLLTGCGGAAKPGTAEAKPSAAGTATEVLVNPNVSPKDTEIIDAVVSQAKLIGLEGAQVNVVSGDDSIVCTDVPNVTVTGSNLFPLYCKTNSTALLPGVWINMMVRQFGGDKDPVARAAALNFIGAAGLGMTMQNQAGMEWGKTQSQELEISACFAGRVLVHTNTPEAQTVADDLTRLPTVGMTIAAAFADGANGKDCARAGFAPYGDPNMPPTTSPLPSPTN